MCREEALTLSDLAARSDKPLNGFGLFGIVKETGVDDRGLAKFHNDFYPHPIYRDDELAFYRALGDRKMGPGSWNPFAIFGKWRKIINRVNGKGIDMSNLKGEGLVQGGVILFDKEGAPRYCYKEVTGEEIPVDDILSAVSAMKN